MNPKLLISTILLLLLASCTYYNYPVQKTSRRLSSIPTPSHNNKIEVLFPGEQINDTHFIKLSVLEVTGTANEPYDEMIIRLQNKAQQVGADAVYIFDRNSNSTIMRDYFNEAAHSVFTGTSVPYYTSENTSVLSAVGIKYIRNIHYLSNYVKKIDLLTCDSLGNRSEVKTSLYMDFDMKVDSVTGNSSYIKNYIQPYSTYHLVYEKTPNWRYRDPKETLLLREYYNQDGFMEKSCRITLNDSKQPLLIEIKKGYKLKDEIKYMYESNRLVKRDLFLSNGYSYIEKYIYENDQLKEVVVFNVDGGKEIPILVLNYIYYENSEAGLFK